MCKSRAQPNGWLTDVGLALSSSEDCSYHSTLVLKYGIGSYVLSRGSRSRHEVELVGCNCGQLLAGSEKCRPRRQERFIFPARNDQDVLTHFLTQKFLYACNVSDLIVGLGRRDCASYMQVTLAGNDKSLHNGIEASAAPVDSRLFAKTWHWYIPQFWVRRKPLIVRNFQIQIELSLFLTKFSTLGTATVVTVEGLNFSLTHSNWRERIKYTPN